MPESSSPTSTTIHSSSTSTSDLPPSKPTSTTTTPPPPTTSNPHSSHQEPTHKIHFTLSKITVPWSRTRPIPILKVAEEAGLKPNFGCRSGMCGTCEVRLLKGDVEGPEGDGDLGILICSSRPTGKGGVVEIEL